MNQALRVELFWCFLTATILRKHFVNCTPSDLSALPDLLELEKETQGGGANNYIGIWQSFNFFDILKIKNVFIVELVRNYDCKFQLLVANYQNPRLFQSHFV